MSAAIGGQQTNTVAAALPPQWVDNMDGVHGLLSDITRFMSILMSMHSTSVGTVFGKDLDDMESKIENLTKDVTGGCFCGSYSVLIWVLLVMWGGRGRRFGDVFYGIGMSFDRVYVIRVVIHMRLHCVYYCGYIAGGYDRYISKRRATSKACRCSNAEIGWGRSNDWGGQCSTRRCK